MTVESGTLPGARPARGPAGDSPARGDGFAGGTRIVRNILALGFAQVFTWLSAAGLAVVLPRYIGDVALGRLTLASSFTELFGLLASLGTAIYLTKEVARSRQAAAPQVLNALASRVPLVLAASGMAVGLALLLGYSPSTMELIYLYCVNIAVVSVTGILTGTLQGLQEMRPVALVNSLSKLTLLALVALFLSQGQGVHGVVLAWVLAGSLGVGGYFLAVVRNRAIGGRIDVATWRPLLFAGLPFFVWQSALLIYGQVDVILLSFFTTEAVIGWYGAAYRIVSIPVFIPMIIMTAVFPAMASAAEHDRPAFDAIARRAMQVVLVATVPIALGTMVIAEPLVYFLGWGEFTRSTPLIIILAMHIPIMGADMMIGTALNSLDKQRMWAIMAVAAALLNPAINCILIPVTDAAYNNGAIGSATATVITELFMMVMGLLLLRGEGVFERSSLMVALKCLAAGALMAALIWPLREMYLPFVVLVGATVYGGASLALGTVSPKDLRALRSYVLDRAESRSTPVDGPGE
ncbi:MAG: flippase [Dehalococcoidia bacterium]